MAMPPRPMGSLVDSAMAPSGGQMDPSAVDIELPEPETFEGGASVTEDGEGGAIIQALVEQLEASGEDLIAHDDNLAEYLDDGYLGELSSDLRASYKEDLSSRSEWEEAYTKGLDQLGVKYEDRTMPFEGASGVTHPLIAESVTQFQAQAYKELLPAGGPVRTNVIGAKTPQREDQANRV